MGIDDNLSFLSNNNRELFNILIFVFLFATAGWLYIILKGLDNENKYVLCSLATVLSTTVVQAKGMSPISPREYYAKLGTDVDEAALMDFFKTKRRSIQTSRKI